MGGLVARGLNTVENYIPNSVENIITFATPHKHAFLCDIFMQCFYEKLNHFWRIDPKTNKFVEKDLENMFVVSIGGFLIFFNLLFIIYFSIFIYFFIFIFLFFNSLFCLIIGSFRDTLIDHPFVDLGNIIPSDHHLSVATDSIPEVLRIILILHFYFF